MRRRTFRSDRHQRRFELLGFVVADAFTPTVVNRLRTAVEEGYRGAPTGFHSSVESRDHAYRARLHALLAEPFQAVVDELFDDHVVLNTAALVKWPGDDGSMGAHQDWTFVDESAARTLNLWCPLDEVDDENGALAVLAGSHRRLDHVRPSPHLPVGYDDPTRALGPADLDPVTVRAGQVVAVDHGLVHGSAPNRTAQPRIAVAAAIAPAGTPLVHHFCHDDDTVERFAVPDAVWFHTFDFGTEPTGLPSQGEVAWHGSTATTEDLRRPDHPTFLDPAVEARFVEDGYVVVDLLGGEALDHLRAGYDQLEHEHVEHPDFVAGFHTTLYDPRVDHRRQVRDLIDATVGRALDDHLVDHRSFFANFMVKQPGGDALPHHVDWTFVDEQRFTSVTAWCVLADATAETGTLGVVRGSHRAVDFVRAVNHRDGDRHAALGQPGDELVLDLRAGQAVVTDNRAVHFSTPNRATHRRVVAACVAAPRLARLHHHWVAPDGHVARLAVEPDFYCTYALGQDPRGAAGARLLDEREDVLIG